MGRGQLPQSCPPPDRPWRRFFRGIHTSPQNCRTRTVIHGREAAFFQNFYFPISSKNAKNPTDVAVNNVLSARNIWGRRVSWQSVICSIFCKLEISSRYYIPSRPAERRSPPSLIFVSPPSLWPFKAAPIGGRYHVIKTAAQAILGLRQPFCVLVLKTTIKQGN